MNFEISIAAQSITLRPEAPRGGLLSRFTSRTTPNLEHLPATDRALAMALADLRALADEQDEALDITSEQVTLSHRLAAATDAELAAQIGLPPLTDLTLSVDAEGVVGSPNFRLRVDWSRNGQRRMPTRLGAILQTDRGPQRIPLWMLEAIEVAERHDRGKGDAADWEALARFRRALEPGVEMTKDTRSARLSMTDFLSQLQVSLADRFSITPDNEGNDFEVMPFSGRSLASVDADAVSEDMSELGGADLQLFQRKVRERGALHAFRLSPGRFLVVDRSAEPALRVMADMQRAPQDIRHDFIRNPRARITAAVEEALHSQGALDGLGASAREEAIEAAAGPTFVETTEFTNFSERVTGVGRYDGNPLAVDFASGTTWLPEVFAAALRERLELAELPRLQHLQQEIVTAIGAGQPVVPFGDVEVPATVAALKEVDGMIKSRRSAQEDPRETPTEPQEPSGPIILQTADNFEEVHWRPARGLRQTDLPDSVPRSIQTLLKAHQVEALRWQVGAWKAGLPGILNADEQGLGKTLQTISFLVWLNDHMKSAGTERGPILVVAPTSLLENWEQEVKRHVDASGLGHLIRLYGGATAGRRKVGTKGKDTEIGDSVLDFSDLQRAMQQGAGHLTWVLTTYTTLTNYQHSLAPIRFAAVVFDEIQALKNPGSLRAFAARTVQADFRIGLTGTPIENVTADLWALMDQLAPGSLGALRAFKECYGEANEVNMAELYDRVFRAHGAIPPLALRRLKDQVARDLPTKSRLLHPRVMPPSQATAYEDARIKLANGGPGAALKMLHHIRTVSVHPSVEDKLPDLQFIGASGRLAAVFDILRQIKSKGERALVFIEHLKMQYRFVELIRGEFGLDRVDIINGETPIQKRQAIVNRFQGHLEKDGGFDLLVLGPRAAGTGLTLTAATHVIHLSRWWNPAVEEQCNDRVHRIGQGRPVTVHLPLAIHPTYQAQSFDLLLQSLMQRKRRLASQALWPMGDEDRDAAALQKLLKEDASPTFGDVVTSSMTSLFQRDGLAIPKPDPNGAWPMQ